MLENFKKSSLFRFIEPSFSLKKWTILTFLQSSAWWAFAWIGIFMLQQVTKSVSSGNFESVKNILIPITILTTSYYFMTWISRYWIWPRFFHAVNRHLTSVYFSRYLLSDISSTERIGTGKFIWLLRGNMLEWSNQLIDFWGFLGQKALFFLIASIVLLVQSPYVGLSFVAFATIAGTILYLTNRWTTPLRKIREEINLDYMRHATRLIMSKTEVLQHGKIWLEIEKIHGYEHSLEKTNERLSDLISFGYNLPSGLLSLIRIGIYGAIAYSLYSMNDLPSIIAVLALLWLFDRFISESVFWYKNFSAFMPKLEQIWHYFDPLPDLYGYEEWIEYVHKTGSVKLQKISFSYDKNSVLENFDLEFEAGKKTALVGASGSWKTTIMKLVSGHLRPESWKILVDWQNLKETSLKSYFSHVGYLTQEPSVFDGTIKENLLYGAKGNVSDEEMQKALEMAECDFVFDFPNGMETEIGEKWIRLSGGQRQRLAIAKIFLKNPKIILLDEPTSALDSFSEEKISKALHTLFSGRTVIVIAHRLQTVKEADRIVVIEDGKIVEDGNHISLVEKKGIYARMLELQSGI